MSNVHDIPAPSSQVVTPKHTGRAYSHTRSARQTGRRGGFGDTRCLELELLVVPHWPDRFVRFLGVNVKRGQVLVLGEAEVATVSEPRQSRGLEEGEGWRGVCRTGTPLTRLHIS